MRILFLTQIIPYPPDAGPRVKTWNVLRYLAGRGHDITLVSFVRPYELEHVAVLGQICTAVHTVPISRSRLSDLGFLLRSNVTGRPFLIVRDDHRLMHDLIGRLMATNTFDVIHADQLTMTQFALEAVDPKSRRRPFTIFDAHNATWTISDRMFQNVPWFLKMLLRSETRRIRRYEGMLVERFDHTMVVIPQDKSALLAGVGNGLQAGLNERFSVIPIAVDTQALQPARRPDTSTNILALGSLNYPPNVDGIRWFMREIFPLVQAHAPETTLTVVGRDPPADFFQIAARQPKKIQVTGYVSDLTPYMNAAALMAVPVRAGSGMRVRLLEAFARAIPAVTTTIGLEGIEATPGQDVLVADTPEEFAKATLCLLRDSVMAARIAASSRRLAEAQYDWQVVLAKLDEVYAQVQASR